MKRGDEIEFKSTGFAKTSRAQVTATEGDFVELYIGGRFGRTDWYRRSGAANLHYAYRLEGVLTEPSWHSTRDLSEVRVVGRWTESPTTERSER